MCSSVSTNIKFSVGHAACKMLGSAFLLQYNRNLEEILLTTFVIKSVLL